MKFIDGQKLLPFSPLNSQWRRFSLEVLHRFTQLFYIFSLVQGREQIVPLAALPSLIVYELLRPGRYQVLSLVALFFVRQPARETFRAVVCLCTFFTAGTSAQPHVEGHGPAAFQMHLWPPLFTDQVRVSDLYNCRI